MARDTQAGPLRGAVTGTLVVATAGCVLVESIRVVHSGQGYYRFLLWNLFLAWVPYWLALAAEMASRRGQPVRSTLLSLAWLLFFPNAPYIISDFVHLHKRVAVPLWYDGLMLSAFATTGLLLGFASLFVMQSVWQRSAGRAVSWVGAVSALGLASIGVYLGRVYRLNSWDAVLHPAQVAQLLLPAMFAPWRHAATVAALGALTILLIAAYVMLCDLTGARFERERRRPNA
jgi:uncharacterized membrane protein